MGKTDQIKALKKDKDIQTLLEDAKSILHNPIALFDTYYSLIAYTDTVTDDPLWNELITTGTFSLETQEFFANAYIILNVTSADKIVVLQTDELKYDRVIAYVFNRNRVKVAVLVMVACDTPLTTDHIVALNAFADKITAKIRNDENFTEFGIAYHSDIIGKILDGHIKEIRIYSPHVQIIYDGFESYLFLAVIDTGKGGAKPDKLAQMRDLLMEKYKSFKFAIYSGCIVMIMSSKQNHFNARRVLGKCDEFFVQNDIYAGVSSCFENLFEMRQYYDEAVTALKSGKKSKSDQRVYF